MKLRFKSEEHNVFTKNLHKIAVSITLIAI